MLILFYRRKRRESEMGCIKMRGSVVLNNAFFSSFECSVFCTLVLDSLFFLTIYIYNTSIIDHFFHMLSTENLQLWTLDQHINRRSPHTNQPSKRNPPSHLFLFSVILLLSFLLFSGFVFVFLILTYSFCFISPFHLSTSVQIDTLQIFADRSPIKNNYKKPLNHL